MFAEHSNQNLPTDPAGVVNPAPFRHAGDALVTPPAPHEARSDGYFVRICDVFGTPWRVPLGLKLKKLHTFTLTNTFREFYLHQQGLPKMLAQEYHSVGSQLSVDGSSEGFDDLFAVEVVLFALPIPVNQVVAAVVVDMKEPAISNHLDSRIRKLRDAMVSKEIRLRVGGQSVPEIVDRLAAEAGALPVEQLPDDTDIDELRPEEERHLLVFAYPADPRAPAPGDLDEQARAVVYGSHWPYQPEFATIKRPDDLNGKPGDPRPNRYAAISHYASVLYGQSGDVNASALLITAQTVGTAARFQLIWSRASRQVEGFQREKQAKTGEQTRDSLAPLADEMGDLELDLTFNVQTAADLGLGSTTAFVDSFQTALHDVMKFKVRAETVAAMFERVNSSIQSELTAIVSREREAEEGRRRAEEKRRIRGAAVIGALSFILAPLSVVFGFFGVNTADVNDNDHVLDFRKFWLVYAVALVLTGGAVAWSAIMMRSSRDRPSAPSARTETELVTVRRRRRGKKRAAERPSSS